MICNEECVEFENPEGFLLRGILHHGNQEVYKKVSLICLNTGLNDMVGWHRLQVKVACFLAENGYNILRFDNFGVGASEGELDEGAVNKLFARIETGMWAHDAGSAVDFMESRFRSNIYIFLGFCGGSLTAIHEAAEDPRINGVINIGAPPIMSTSEHVAKTDPWTVKQKVVGYRKKVLSPKSIINLFTGRSDYREVYRSVFHFLKHKFYGRYGKEGKNDEVKIDINNLNYSFFDSFEKYMKNPRPILFYYAQLDNATWAIKKYFLPKYENKKVWKDSGCEYVEIEGANHIFSRQDSQAILKQDILKWLENF